MEGVLNITLPGRREKSYVRSDYRTDTIFNFFRYKDVSVSFAKKEGTTTRLTDLFARELLALGYITPAQYRAYEETVCREYCHKDRHPEQSPEEIYAFICRARSTHFGLPALTLGREYRKNNPVTFSPDRGICQEEKKRAMMAEKKALIFLITQPELFSLMARDLSLARSLGKQSYVCVSPRGEGDLPHREQLSAWLAGMEGTGYILADAQGIRGTEELRAIAEEGAAGLLFYGEDGFLHCRSLALDAVVTAVPAGYHAQALCNQLGSGENCMVYIPAGLDITPWVSLTAQTRLTYYHLAKLQRAHGDGVYALPVEQLYGRYGQTFLNVYDNLSGKALPLEVHADSFPTFDAARDGAVADYLNSFSNIRYTGAFFDADLERQPIPYGEDKPGILVHTVRVTRAKAARVMGCEKGVTPRQLFARKQLPGTALVSNFLFFLTPKLGALYNDLRSDRPMEQADAAAGHLDYMLLQEGEQRIETFPLFCKTCIAMTRQGQFLFFPFRLGGGTARIGSTPVRWEREWVDPENPGEICVYTPFRCAGQEQADRETYREAVGAGRVNFIVLQDRITCIRKGDVILPSVGVVLSMTEEAAAPLLAGLPALPDGYYDVSGVTLSVHLDAPRSIAPEQWEQVTWAYGGGMTLIREGESLCDGGDMTEWFARDGWLTPLSRQTQESALHKLAKHPRTAIGTAENGDLVILVYSGRTSRSSGADYREMIAIARKLYPDISNLMNVDGGGSAVLGMTWDGSFMELSCPATSTGSCVGMVRPVHTLFCIPAEKERKQ